MKFQLSTTQKIMDKMASLRRFFSHNDQMTQQDIEKMMSDQFGHGWMDRLILFTKELTPGRVDQIIKNASSRTSGNLGELYQLEQLVMSDPRVGGMIDKRTQGVTRVNVDVQVGDPDDPRSVEMAELMDRWIQDIKLKSWLEQCLEGKLHGVTAFHNIIFRDGDRYIFDDPTKNQISQSRWFQETSDKDDNWGKLYLKKKDKQATFTLIDKIFLDDDQFVHPAQLSLFTYKEKRGYYDTQGIMYRVLKLYIMKIWVQLFWVQKSERHGKPFIYALLDDTNFKDPKFKGDIKSILKQFGAEHWGIFPSGMDIKALDTSSATSSAMFKDLLNFANTEMAIALLGQNLSTEVQGGSYGATVSHSKVEENIIEDDIEWIEEHINDQTFYWMQKVNDPELPTEKHAQLKITPKRDVDMEKIVRGYKGLTELVDVPVAEIRERTGSRAPKLKDNHEEFSGVDKYEEEVVGVSTRRRTRLDQIYES